MPYEHNMSIFEPYNLSEQEGMLKCQYQSLAKNCIKNTSFSISSTHTIPYLRVKKKFLSFYFHACTVIHCLTVVANLVFISLSTKLITCTTKVSNNWCKLANLTLILFANNLAWTVLVYIY